MRRCTLADDGTLLYICPGCGGHHGVNAERWHWNGDLEKPTLSPSVKHTYPEKPPHICHYFIRAGLIEYCRDSTHALAGKTVDLPDIDRE